VLVASLRAKIVWVEVERAHASREGALDIEPNAVSNMNCIVGGNSDGLESGAEDAYVGFFGTDVCRVDNSGDGGAGAEPHLAHANLPEVPVHPALGV
jgi:hypothetical protein